jgi:ADP-ribosylglycohydrolase
MSEPSREDRLLGGLYGLLVGDALGVPYEFHDAEDLPAEIELAPPPSFARAHASIPPGTWSDDGAQALALLASLLDHGGTLDHADFARRLVRWRDAGYCAVDRRVFDVGVQTSKAIELLRAGGPPLEAGLSGERHNGNGSLMRVLPLALVFRGDDTALVEAAYRSSRPTHGHARALVCCALYCLWARRLLEGVPDAWRGAVTALRAQLEPDGPESVALEDHIRPDDPPEGRGSGYVVDSLGSARLVFDEHASFRDVVVAAVRLGDDTDTTAAIAGGLAGVRGGLASIPKEWLAALRGKEIVEPLAARLVAFAKLPR